MHHSLSIAVAGTSHRIFQLIEPFIVFWAHKTFEIQFLTLQLPLERESLRHYYCNFDTHMKENYNFIIITKYLFVLNNILQFDIQYKNVKLWSWYVSWWCGLGRHSASRETGGERGTRTATADGISVFVRSPTRMTQAHLYTCVSVLYELIYCLFLFYNI